jgi:(p)ppGpp synthase/HD superfamily hydrolase
MGDHPDNATPASRLAESAPLILEATQLAWAWHGNQTRKGRSTSYVSHLLEVTGLVIRAGGGHEAVIAALLHDGLEDAPDPEQRARREALIRERFGPAVLQIVLDCTDTTAAEASSTKGPWRERKERYIAQLAAAGPDSRLVAACDKRQNLGDLISDLRFEGLDTLDRFNAGATEQLWYFESLLEVFRSAVPGVVAAELEALVSEFRGWVDTPTVAARPGRAS